MTGFIIMANVTKNDALLYGVSFPQGILSGISAFREKIPGR